VDSTKYSYDRKKISGALREEKIAENANDSDYNINFISTSRLLELSGDSDQPELSKSDHRTTIPPPTVNPALHVSL
jgi:hypothetical protein